MGMMISPSVGSSIDRGEGTPRTTDRATAAAPRPALSRERPGAWPRAGETREGFE